MTRRSSPLFAGALLAAGAFGVHQLRYLAAHGDDAGAALHASGHGYLTAAEPLLGLLLAFAVAQLLMRAVRGSATRAPLGRRALALAFGAALLAIYTGQELVEGQLAAGHAAGLDGVLGHGGWIAIPLAAAIGGVLSLAVHLAAGATAALHTALTRAPRPAAPRATTTHVTPRAAHARRAPLARHQASRGPPPATA